MTEKSCSLVEYRMNLLHEKGTSSFSSDDFVPKQYHRKVAGHISAMS